MRIFVYEWATGGGLVEEPGPLPVTLLREGAAMIGALAPRLLRPEYRLTLDEAADYELLRRIYETLYRPGEPVDVIEALAYLDAHPEVARINAHVQQKTGNLYAQELAARVLAAQGGEGRAKRPAG